MGLNAWHTGPANFRTQDSSGVWWYNFPIYSHIGKRGTRQISAEPLRVSPGREQNTVRYALKLNQALEESGRTRFELAQAVGLSTTHLNRFLRLATLDGSVLDYLLADDTERHNAFFTERKLRDLVGLSQKKQKVRFAEMLKAVEIRVPPRLRIT